MKHGGDEDFSNSFEDFHQAVGGCFFQNLLNLKNLARRNLGIRFDNISLILFPVWYGRG